MGKKIQIYFLFLKLFVNVLERWYRDAEINRKKNTKTKKKYISYIYEIYIYIVHLDNIVFDNC